MNEKIPVNDGGGLYDNAGLCQTLLQDLNSAVKCAMTGQYLQFCAIVAGATQKLINLEKGITADLASKDKIIEELKSMNNALNEQLTGIPTEKDGVSNGND